MNYQQTIEYLYSRLPIYQNKGVTAYKADIGNISKASNQLGNPHKKFKSIHVAGTNGKGSVSHMIASILQEAGYKVGLYTSPHLKDFRERIKINGNLISKKEVIDFISNNKIEFRRGNAGGGNQLRQPYLKDFVKNIKIKQFKNVEKIHFFGYYIGNYPSLKTNKIKNDMR